MRRAIRTRITYANVVATLALFCSLGAASWAAFQLPKDSVRSKHIVKGAVKPQDLAAAAVRRGKIAPAAVNSARLADGGVAGADLADGGVGAADLGTGAVTPPKIAAAEQPRRVGAAGQPQFHSNNQRIWTSLLSDGTDVVFYKDQLGNVHLEGVALCVSNTDQCDPPTAGRIFTLPPGYRPAQTLSFVAASGTSATPGKVVIYGIGSSDAGQVNADRINTSAGGSGNIDLSSVEFRAAG